MFESPFSKEVSFVILRQESGEGTMSTHPEELAVLSPRVAPKRRAEFVLGRQAARAALEQLGLENPPPILKGSAREPLWPNGIVGSITHSDGWAVAAVAWNQTVRAIGIDLQRVTHRRQDISGVICRDAESAWVNAAPDRWGRLTELFSAKESIYKAFSSETKVVLSWKDVELTWNDRRSGFDGALLRTIPGSYDSGFAFKVGCLRRGDFVFTHIRL